MADTKKDDKKPTTQASAPAQPQQQAVSVLEEDDEFEEFENGKIQNFRFLQCLTHIFCRNVGEGRRGR